VRLLHRRQKLGADLRRVEHLVATDMSATRQLGNRLAYEQLLDELRRTPDVFPSSFQFQNFESWDEPIVASRSWLSGGGLSGNLGRSKSSRFDGTVRKLTLRVRALAAFAPSSVGRADGRQGRTGCPAQPPHLSDRHRGLGARPASLNRSEAAEHRVHPYQQP
jgi:hypothetical protein